MNETTAKLIENVVILGLFAACAVAFEMHGDNTHAVAAFAALAAFAGVNRPPSGGVSMPQAVRSVAPAAVAFMVAAAAASLSGCASLPAAVGAIGAATPYVVRGTCGAASKLCEAADPTCGSGACHAFHDGCAFAGSFVPETPVQIACEPPADASAGPSKGLRFGGRTRLRGAAIEGDQPRPVEGVEGSES